MNTATYPRLTGTLSLLLMLTACCGCSDYGIKEGDNPQIIALKKLGARVSTIMTGGQVIDLHDSGIDDDDLVHIEELPNVVSLNLSGTDVTDAGLSHIVAGPKRLSELFLDNTSVTDEGIATLAELKGLSYLSLPGTPITDETLALLPKNHPRIRDLDLSGCEKISNDGLKSVAELRGLQKLTLQQCPQITDDGLEHLMGKRGMQMIRLIDTGCTNAAVERLAKSTGAPFVVNTDGKPAGPLARFAKD